MCECECDNSYIVDNISGSVYDVEKVCDDILETNNKIKESLLRIEAIMARAYPEVPTSTNPSND